MSCLREQCIASIMLRQGVLVKLICYAGYVTGRVQTIDPSGAEYVGNSFLFKVRLL